MSNDRMKPLMLAAVIGLLGAGSAGFAAGGALAQNPPKGAPEETPRNVQEKHDNAPEPVQETKPSEQTQDAAGGVTVPDYRDDRSTPQALIESYYNAINRKEYARAYGYYSEEGREPDFKTFLKGYENTKSVKVALRKTDPDPGRGRFTGASPWPSKRKRRMARRKSLQAAIRFTLQILPCRRTRPSSRCRS